MGALEETNTDNLLIWEQRSVLGNWGNINIIIIQPKPLPVTPITSSIVLSARIRIKEKGDIFGKKDVNIQ